MIYLIGFMGAGKSAVGMHLSRLMQTPLIDTDQYIENEQKKSIPDIFKESGEAYFRSLETEALRQIAKKGEGVVSCGGGIVLKEENITIMKESGLLVLLRASPETIYGRVRYSTNRPKLDGHMDIAYITALMKEREPFYERAQALEIDTDGKNVSKIAHEIFKFL